MTQGARRCPDCGNKYPLFVARCPDDGSLLTMSGPLDEEVKTLAGTTIDGRFYVGRLLGQGAMGRVYRGSQLSIGRPVAIKVLRRKLWRDETVRMRFLREAKLVASFNHRNIVRLIDYGEQDRLLYMVMEYIDGVPLQRLMRGRPMTFDFALEIVDQVAAALMEAHARNVVHRDVKPDNVFLLRDSDDQLAVKVLDFGIAHVDKPVFDVDENLTRDGMVFGTPEYMSPEQARGKTVDAASDLYALGVLFFEALTGELPIQGRSPMETMVFHIKRDAPYARDVATDVPVPIADLAADLLKRKRDERISSAREVRVRVAKIRKDLGIAPLEPLAEGDLEATLESRFVRASVEIVAPRLELAVESITPLELGGEGQPDDRGHTPPQGSQAAKFFDTTSPLFLLVVLVTGVALGVGAAAAVVLLAN